MPFGKSLNLTLHFSATPGRRPHATVGINCMVRLLKQVVNEAAGEKTPEA